MSKTFTTATRRAIANVCTAYDEYKHAANVCVAVTREVAPMLQHMGEDEAIKVVFEVVGKHYGAAYGETKAGVLRWTKPAEGECTKAWESARKCARGILQTAFPPADKPVAKADPIARLAEQVAALSGAERKRFLKLAGLI
jgi:hypothetical protein